MSRRVSPSPPLLPPDLSPGDEARWWDEHCDYWDTMETEDELVAPQGIRHTKPINLRLPIDMIEALKLAEARRAVSYQALIRTWLKERLDIETSDS